MEVEIGIGKSGRRAYGFDDIAIVPSRRTRDPEDVDISWEIDAYKLRAAADGASAMDGVVSPTHRDRDRPARRARVPEPRRSLDALRRPRAVFEEIAALEPEKATRRMQEIYAGADQGRAHRPAHPRRSRTPASPRARRSRRSASSSTRKRDPRGRARHPRRAGHGRLGRARVEGPDRASRSTSRSSSASSRSP